MTPSTRASGKVKPSSAEGVEPSGDDLRLLDDGHGDIRLGLLHVRCRGRLLPLALAVVWDVPVRPSETVRSGSSSNTTVTSGLRHRMRPCRADRTRFRRTVSRCTGILAELCLEARQGRFALIGKGVVICLLVRILRLSCRVDGCAGSGSAHDPPSCARGSS